MCAPRCLNLSNNFCPPIVTHLNLLDVFWARGQKSFYIHKGLWITENCIKLSNLITVSTKHNRYLQPYGERWLEEGKEQGRGGGGEKRKVPTMSIYNADAVYVSKEAFVECVHVCVCVYVGVCVSLTKDLQGPMRAFENA